MDCTNSYVTVKKDTVMFKLCFKKIPQPLSMILGSYEPGHILEMFIITTRLKHLNNFNFLTTSSLDTLTQNGQIQ